ncbi:helix-turn-helix domain-containing protein [Novosphingobium sp. LASN5T]|uniref:helix-turn-helix domain-containing protein n=1 Tax=Novosphingobium sp. LASN5T TaxID=2491021 RepID=UPI000F5F658B|nr:helix-turn-helix domain-containing protein [Novosphingobium sp. LASN5T]RQW43735.1 helix-turn-helix domain-containing protein [Novosphingobium sp. LASN5T]
MRGKEVKRFTLYGEDGRTIGPEFVHIERIADRSSLHDWTIAPHSHPGMAQVLMIETGTVDVASDGSARKIAAPACMIVPSGCVHAFRFAVAAEGWVLSMAIALLHDPRIAGLLEGLGLDGGGLRVIPLETEDRQRARLSWLLADMADRLEQGLRATPALIAQLGLVLATLGETLAASLPQDAGKDRRAVLVARYRGMIEAQYRDHWPIERYAHALGVTSSTLTRACRAVVDKSPGDILHDRLALEAMRFLAFTGMGMAQIAHRLGFEDPAYFARFFKNRTGETASAFRAQRAWEGLER